MKKATKAGTSKQSAEIKRKLYAAAFVANGENKTQAAIAAGFGAKYAHQAGARLYKDVRVIAEINKLRDKIIEKADLSIDRVASEISKIAFCDPRKLVEDKTFKQLHELDDDLAAAISSVKVLADGTVEYKFWDKTKALDMANKITGAYQKHNEQKAELTIDATDAAARVSKLLSLAKAKKDGR